MQHTASHQFSIHFFNLCFGIAYGSQFGPNLKNSVLTEHQMHSGLYPTHVGLPVLLSPELTAAASCPYTLVTGKNKLGR